MLNEVLPLARKSDADDPRLGHTRALIGCLARLDLRAALALIPDKGDERTINDLRGLIAQSIAATPGRGRTADRPDDVEQLRDLRGEGMPADGDGRPAPGAADRRTDQERRAPRLRPGRGWPRRSPRPTAPRPATSGPSRSGRSARRWSGASAACGAPESAAVMAAALLPGVERTDPDRLAEAVDRVLSLRWHPRSVLDLTMTIPDTERRRRDADQRGPGGCPGPRTTTTWPARWPGRSSSG